MKTSLFVRIAELIKRKWKTSGLPVNIDFLSFGILVITALLSLNLVLLNALAKTSNLSQVSQSAITLSPTLAFNRKPSSTEFSSKLSSQDYKKTVALLTFVNDENKEINNCTGTYINYKNNCYLLTNEHCFSSSVKSVKVVNHDNQVSTQSAQDFIIDRKKDLAVLSLRSSTEVKLDDSSQSPCNLAPSYLENDIQKIEQLNEEIPWDDFQKNGDNSSYFIHSISLGYVNKNFLITETGDQPYHLGPVEKIKTSLNMNYLIRASKLQMYKGMSGGPVFNNNKLLGIKPTFIAEQYVTHIIPLPEILKFIENHLGMTNTSLALSNPIIHSKYFVFGGENTGSNGGENSGSNGTENRLSPLSSTNLNHRSTIHNLKDVLSLLQEPAEGIILDSTKNERLLAVCKTNQCSSNTKNAIQIDGRDEWNQIKDSFSDNNLFYIYENSDYFIENKSKIFDRVFPNFVSGNPTRGGVSYITLKPNTSGTFSTQSALLGNPVFTLENTSTETGSFKALMSSLSFTSKNSITVNLSVSNFTHVSASFKEASYPSRSFTFHLELDKAGSTIHIKEDDGTIYECKNSYFYKIICFANGKILSFSRSKINKDILYIRFAEIIRSNAETEKPDEGIIYYYSALEIKND